MELHANLTPADAIGLHREALLAGLRAGKTGLTASQFAQDAVEAHNEFVGSLKTNAATTEAA